MLNGRTKGAIVGMGLVVGVVTGGVWASAPGDTTSTPAASCGQVFAGRAGSINTCKRIPDDQVARNIKQGVGTTFTGCVVGLASGGPAGAIYGCLGGLVSNIPWNGWPNAN